MSQNDGRRIAAMAALIMFVGYVSDTKSSAKNVGGEPSAPKARTAFYRADPKSTAMPHVLMSKQDEAACKVKVGDAMPSIELPKLGGTEERRVGKECSLTCRSRWSPYH